MKTNVILSAIIFIQIEQCVKIVFANLQNDIASKLKEENSTTLSRKRRYLVFPEGSSFQVACFTGIASRPIYFPCGGIRNQQRKRVYDLTYPAIAIQGNVFMFGHTAAMAWELPSTPIFLDEKKMKKEEIAETTTMESIPEYLENSPESDYDWQPPLAWDYHAVPESSGWQNDVDRSSIMYHANNPFVGSPHHSNYLQHFGYINNGYSDRYESKIYKTNPTQFWSRTNFGRTISQSNTMENSSPEKINRSVFHHIQRRSRRELYNKIEKLLTALSKDGKSCILKAICQVNKLASRKGSLWEEIIKAIFRVKFDIHPAEDHYDRAANVNHDCDKMYPSCDGHVLSNLFRNRI